MSSVAAAQMSIIGAGMAGLVAAHTFRGHAPVIIEAQRSLPNNHEALLRFRSDKVSGITGIPFHKCSVRKSIYYEGQYFCEANPYLANAYSRKVVHQVQDRSIWNLEPATRYIAPRAFLETMAAPLKINYNAPVDSIDVLTTLTKNGPVVSTIPMPIMMKLIGWKDIPDFKTHPIYSSQIDLVVPKTDVYQTIYFPDPVLPYYRASITGSRLIVEFSSHPGTMLTSCVANVVSLFGLDPAHYYAGDLKLHRYGKIAPIEDDLRREFIYTLTREYGVYSLGRFATWRSLLLDDVVGDCGIIERLISGEARRSRYNQSLATVRSL